LAVQRIRNLRNAIKVINISGMQVGHIPKDIAAKIALLIDRKLVTIEGTMLSGNCESPRLVVAHGVLTLSQ